jgi:hypothetical protein
MKPTCLPIKGTLSITGAVNPHPLAYVVTAYHNGSVHEHSLVVGVYADEAPAVKAVEDFEKRHKFCYECMILEVPVNVSVLNAKNKGFKIVKRFKVKPFPFSKQSGGAR